MRRTGCEIALTHGAAHDTTSHRLTRGQRRAAGKALRGTVPRESHAAFTPDPRRDALAVLTAGDHLRMRSLLPERYRRMAASPFAFFRGAAALMAHDLAGAPRPDLPVQACGDCHLLNFGVFSSPEGNVLFDINDFDETLPGVDFTVDLKRLAASVAVAAVEAGLPDRRAHALAASTVLAYRDLMSDLAKRSPLEVWQSRMDFEAQVKGFDDADLEMRILKALLKAERKGTAVHEQPGLERDDDGGSHFIDKPPLIFHRDADGRSIGHVLSFEALHAYRATLLPECALLLDRYTLRDVAFKAVGIGSVGTFCAVALMETPDGEQIILQLKQALASVVTGLAPGGAPTGHQGRRVVDGQRAMQAASDVFLGWTQDDDGRQFYLRRLKNRRLGSLAELVEGEALPAYAALCGRTLARAHARSGDPAAISGYAGKSEALDAAVADFAMAYAAQTAADHAALVASKLLDPRPAEAA